MSKNLVSQKLSASDMNALLRGIAILAVVAIHLLANIPHAFRTTSVFWPYSLVIDQASRFCVPIFVILSGYGFWQKYQQTEFNWLNFWLRQAQKLLPLYILASLIFYIIFLLIPQWRDPEVTRSFIVQLLTGKADYQLYFVPAIFQLYLLFPLLRWAVKNFPWVTLVIALIFQIWLYGLYNATSPNQFVAKYLLTDQQQYIWFFTWIFYFVLGLHLSKILAWFSGIDWKVVTLGLVSMGALSMVILRAYGEITHSIDPVIALRFTHLDLMIYASFLSIFLFVISKLWRFQTKKLIRLFLWLGRYSYPIYLFQTMVLRILFYF